MIKTTLAVMASLMLVACGNGDEPKGTNSDGQNANDVVASKAEAAKAEADAAKAAPGNTVLGAAPTLTLTYFNLDG